MKAAHTHVAVAVLDKKLIRWDNERELSLRRHRTRTTKYNRLVHINSAMHRLTRLEQCRFTEFSEITQCNGHYAIQGRSRSSILVPIESSYTISYYWLILTYILSYNISKLWLIIGQIFVSESGVPNFNALAGVTPANLVINDIDKN